MPKIAPPKSLAERATPVPERDKLDGRCTIIYTGQNEIDVRKMGRAVAEAADRPLPDVTRELRTSKGIIASGLPAARAVELAQKLEIDLHIQLLVIPDADCMELPQPSRMREPQFSANGLRCEAYTWSDTGTLEVLWDDVFLICCGRLEISEAIESASAPQSGSFGLRRPPPPLSMITRYEFLLDIILREPWRRLRLDQNLVAFSFTEIDLGPEQTLGPLNECARALTHYAAEVPMNRGVSLLAAGAADAAWQSLTFFSKRDFDLYAHWLLQLTRYGCAIPD